MRITKTNKDHINISLKYLLQIFYSNINKNAYYLHSDIKNNTKTFLY